MRKRIHELKTSKNTSRLAAVTIASSQLKKNAPKVTNTSQLDWKAKVATKHDLIKTLLLTDTGASAESMIDTNFVKLHKLPTVKLVKAIRLELADGSLADTITHIAKIEIMISDHKKQIWSLVTSLPNFDIILGMPWLEKHNPDINYADRVMSFNSDHCCANCNPFFEIVSITEPESRLRKKNLKKQPPNTKSVKNHDISHLSAYSFLKMTRRKNHEVVAMWPEHFETLNKPAEQDRYLLTSTFTSKIAAITAEDYEKFFSKLRKEPMSRKKLRAHLPEELKDKAKCFDAKKANKLPPRRDHDHKINLVPGAKPRAQKIYGLTKDQASVIKAYVDEMLKKDFIRPSSSRFAAPVLVVKKPEESLRVCIDYKSLNALTIKNRNCPPLIKETLARLCAAKYYTKLDVIAAFNEIRIREDDEKKTTFLTRYDLYEYVVMPFGLCNAPGTFQSYINDVLRKYLNDFCTAYLDDVLVYSNNKEDHIKHVRKVLNKLHAAKLFLNINKCEFFVNEVKYLGLIITTEGVKMDPKKVQAILNWKTPSNIKDVQAFLNFANFYRKFIAGYSRLVQPLTALTRASEKEFVFPWNPDGPEKKTFLTLKIAFTTAPILQHFDPDKETWIESDASDWVVAAVLSQRDSNGVLRPVAFMSQKMLPAECNYEIYDKELLTIVRAFEEWRPECAGTSPSSPIKVLSDHKNLETFMTTKQLNRRQAKWAEFLAKFNFQITYRPGTEGTKPDSLTRRSQDLPADNSDERRQFNNQTILKPKNLNPGVRNAIKLGEEIHQLETATTRIAMMAYPDLVKVMASETPQQDSDDENSDSKNESMTEAPIPQPFATINPPVSMTEAPVPRPFPATDPPINQQDPATDPPVTSRPPVIDSPVEPSDQAQNDTLQYSNFLPRIQAAYRKDSTLQTIMKAKNDGDRRIPARLIKKGIRLELGDCEIKFGLLWVKGRLHMPKKKSLQTDVIKHIHESFQGGHAERTITYERLSTHYY